MNKQLMEFNNDPNKSQKKYQVNDLPDYVLEEAGCVKKNRVKETAVMVTYTAEKVENYMGDQDVDTIVKSIEDPTPMKKKKERTKKCTEEEVPEDIKRQINQIAVSMIVDQFNARLQADAEKSGSCSAPEPEPKVEEIQNNAAPEPGMKLKRISCYKIDKDHPEYDNIPSNVTTYQDNKLIISFDADGLKDQLVDFWESHPEDEIPDDVKEKIREHKQKRNRGDNNNLGEEETQEECKDKEMNQREQKMKEHENPQEKPSRVKTEEEIRFHEFAKQKCLDDVKDKLPENIRDTLGQMMDSFMYPSGGPKQGEPNKVQETIQRDQKPRDPEKPSEKSPKDKTENRILTVAQQKCVDGAKARLPENVREPLGQLMDFMIDPTRSQENGVGYFDILNNLHETNQRNKKLEEEAFENKVIEDVEDKDHTDVEDKDYADEEAEEKVNHLIDFWANPPKDPEDRRNHPGYKIEVDMCGKPLDDDNDVSPPDAEIDTKKNIEGKVKTKKARKPKKPLERGICDNPSCIAQSVHRCSRCLQAAFCSMQCHVTHWPVHQADCTPWRQRGGLDTVTTVD